MLLISILFTIVFVSGCSKLTPEDIVADPEKFIEKCNKMEEASDREGCLNNYAKIVSLTSERTGVRLCTNLESGFPRNKCIFEVYRELETAGRVDEAVNVCKDIDKEGFLEWCESRRSGDSIAIAPSLA